METTQRHLWPSLFASEYSTAPLRVSRFTITDYRPKLARLNFAQGLVHSSNVTTAQVMRVMGGGEVLRTSHERLGLHEPLALGISEVGAPRPPARWGKTESVTASYGHGFAVTPVHLLRAFSAIVNGGQLPEPTLLKRTGPAPEGRRVFSPETSEVMRSLVRLVVLEGSGRKADVEGYLIGGKTGTANQISAAGVYDDELRITTFVSSFPADAPRYTTLVMVENPKPAPDSHGFATAGWVSTGPTARLIARIAPLLGVEPRNGEEFDASARALLSPPPAAPLPELPAPSERSPVTLAVAVDGAGGVGGVGGAPVAEGPAPIGAAAAPAVARGGEGSYVALLEGLGETAAAPFVQEPLAVPPSAPSGALPPPGLPAPPGSGPPGEAESIESLVRLLLGDGTL